MLLDTNIIIDLFKGDRKLSDFLNEQPVIYTPSIVVGELYVGAYRTLDHAKHIKKINDFMARCTILSADYETADHYGYLKADLMKKGKPIPENDMWIAAIAKQYELKTLTKDQHFQLIPGISVIFWQ